MFNKNKPLIFKCLLFTTIHMLGCDYMHEQKVTKKATNEITPIPGINDVIPIEITEKGQVLISYSDCYICHKTDQKSVGPSFEDIAKRYPANKDYIEMLARKIIMGGNGIWGSPIMDAHPKLPLEDAKMMVSYIMTLKK